MNLTVVGVLTRSTPPAKDWENSLKKFKYNYKIIGMGKKWEGWLTKTKFFLNYLKSQPDDENHIYWLTDVDDVFFQMPPLAALQTYRLLLEREGLEWGSVVESAHSRCTGRYVDEFKGFNKLPKKDFFFGDRVTINSGSVIGSRNKLIELESKSLGLDTDDQIAHLKLLSSEEMKGKYYIDKYNELTATILPTRVYTKQPHFYLKHGNLYLREISSIPIAIHTPVQTHDFGRNTEVIRNYLFPDREKIATNVYLDIFFKKHGVNPLLIAFGFAAGVLLILLIAIGIRALKSKRTSKSQSSIARN